MPQTITVSTDVYKLLHRRSEETQTPLDTLAENALRGYFAQEDKQWRKSFETLIARAHARTAKFTPED